MRSIIILLLLTNHLLLFGQIDSVRSLADEISDGKDKVLWLLRSGFECYHDSPDLARQLALDALNLARKQKFEEGIARSHHILGIVYWHQGLYLKALEHNLEARRIYEKLKLNRRVMLIDLNCANVYGELDEHRQSADILKSIYQKAKMTGDTSLILLALNNVVPEYRKLNRFDSARMCAKEALKYATALNDTLYIIGIHTNLSVVLNGQKLPYASLEHSQTARSLLDFMQNKKKLANVQINFAESYRQLKKFDLMKMYMDSAFSLAIEIDAAAVVADLYDGYAEYFEEKNDYQRAFFSLKKWRMLNDSLSSNEIKKEVKNLQLQYEDEKNQKQIAQLEKERAQGRLKLNTILLVSVVIFLGASLLIYRQKLKIIRADQREKSLHAKLEQKTQELTAYALNFIQKNELMNDLIKKINELIEKSDAGISNDLNRMKGIIKGSFRLDQDWENFKLMFEEIHGDFFKRLKDEYPELGNAELKLCALLRLNMSLKESSSVLGISTNSVKTARHRIRKKLGLSTTENLSDFLINFDFESQQLPASEYNKLI